MRKNSSEVYNESHFMDFLTSPPHEKNTLKNSFRGVRKYYRFLDKIELEFGICFRISDLDTYYSLGKLTKKVIERINKPKGNLKIIRSRLNEKNFYFEFIILFLILSIVFFFRFHIISIIINLLLVLILFWAIEIRVYNRKQMNQLYKRITS